MQLTLKAISRHRLVRSYRAEAEGYSIDQIIEESLFFVTYILFDIIGLYEDTST